MSERYENRGRPSRASGSPDGRRRRGQRVDEALADRLTASIARGELKPDQPLPSRKALARDLHASDRNVGRAIALLDGRGTVIRQGSGRPTLVAGEHTRRLLSSAEVVKELKGAISRGEFKPGQQLPTQRALALRLHTTRGAVGIAIELLAARGLVTRRGSGRRALVADTDARHRDTRTREGNVHGR